MLKIAVVPRRLGERVKSRPKSGHRFGQNVSRPPFLDFDSERRGRRASLRVWRENLSGSTSRRLLAREVDRYVDRLGPAMPADNANGARLRTLYPLLFGESDLGADL
jgi:hypothetical protein